jgi:hypothetical protein
MSEEHLTSQQQNWICKNQMSRPITHAQQQRTHLENMSTQLVYSFHFFFLEKREKKNAADS